MSHYDSDGSTLVNEHHEPRGNNRSRRQRSPSPPPYIPEAHYDPNTPHEGRRQSQSYYYGQPQNYGDRKNKYATIGKVAVVVGIVGVLLHKWQKEQKAREAEREREYRHKRRKEFERNKRRRRREEERREREEEERDEPQSPPAEVRRIEYRPRSRSSSSDSSRSRRRIDAPAGRSARGSRGSDGRYEDERRARSRYQD